MIKAIFFDFHTVWKPDRLAYYLAMAEQYGPEVYESLYEIVEKYYHGAVQLEYVCDAIRIRLGQADVTVDQFKTTEADIAPSIVKLIQNLRAQYIKVGILANLGADEFDLLAKYTLANNVFDTVVCPISLSTPETLLSKEVFEGALRAIGEPPEQTMIISGNPYMVQFAASFNIYTMHFEGLNKLENNIFDRLNQLRA
jgi:FMN phosphatase YigB (HAD superfamily)